MPNFSLNNPHSTPAWIATISASFPYISLCTDWHISLIFELELYSHAGYPELHSNSPPKRLTIVLLLKTISSFNEDTELLTAESYSTKPSVVVKTPKLVELSTRPSISVLLLFIPDG